MRRKPIILAAALAAATVPAVMATSASAAVTPAWSTYFMAGGTAPVTGMKVSGYTGKQVYVAVSTAATGATLRINNAAGTSAPFGFTGGSNLSGSSVQFIGTQDQVNAALASLTISLPATTNSKVVIKTTAFESTSGLFFFPQDQHFYKFSPAPTGGINATDAAKAAEASSEMGQAGYLANVTSQAENDFVAEKIQGAGTGSVRNVWIGGSDDGDESKWTFRAGPEKGEQFWDGCSPEKGGKAVNGAFTSWAKGEPNDWGTGACDGTAQDENSIVINKQSNDSDPVEIGGWNDLPTNYKAKISGYVAEYGNAKTGGTFANVDLVDSTMNVRVPENKPTFLDTLFRTVFGPKKSKVPVPKKISKADQAKAAKKAAKETRLKYNLVFQNGGRFSFYLTNQSTNKLIPIAAGSSIAGRKLTKDYSVPVIRDIKANQTVKVTLDANTKKLAKGALLNVILQEKQADGSFKLYRQDTPDPPLVKVN